jgi:hypothetical protein
MSMHVRILGWIFVACGVLAGAVGMIVIFASQLLLLLPFNWPPDIPFGPDFALGIAVAVGIAIVAVAASIAATGAGLLYYKSWGRVLAIVIAVLMLVDFPVGTAIGVYALWVLLSASGREHYRTHAAASAAG